MNFVLPPKPMPREVYAAKPEPIKKGEGKTTLRVQVLQNGEPLQVDGKNVTYERNYQAFYHTFEPFRQHGHDYALVSRYYTGTSVLDLQTGEIIAEEPIAAGGFCPVEFYVPDWWDVHSGRTTPGSEYWREYDSWPHEGNFGFVAGCIWADDSRWKIQYLDLSNITQGVIIRDERFGYVPLAHGVRLKDAVTLEANTKTLELAVARWFNIENGRALGVYGEDPDDDQVPPEKKKPPDHNRQPPIDPRKRGSYYFLCTIP